MGVYLGVDSHFRTQTVCRCGTADGEIHQPALGHQRGDVRNSTRSLAAPAVVGVEGSGYAVWFHHLVEETVPARGGFARCREVCR